MEFSNQLTERQGVAKVQSQRKKIQGLGFMITLKKKRKVENRTSSVGWNGRRVGNVLTKCRQGKEIPQIFHVNEMKLRFTSKLSLCMDVWTGPNRMSFLGITFTYLDEDFAIQRGLLEMLKMKQKHTGAYIAELFQKAIDLYQLDKDMIGGVTQDNASNCGTCTDALVESGYDRQIFYGCFLHVLNLACQAAIAVYDDSRLKKELRIRLAEDSDFSGSEDSHDEDDPDYDDAEADEYDVELQEVQNHSNAVFTARKLAVFINRNDNRREMFAKCQHLCNLKQNLLIQDIKVRWNSTHDMIARLISNEKALKLLPTMNPEVLWPLLSDSDWGQLKELNEFLRLFKDLTLNFSKTTECRMSDVCLDFEDHW